MRKLFNKREILDYCFVVIFILMSLSFLFFSFFSRSFENAFTDWVPMALLFSIPIIFGRTLKIKIITYLVLLVPSLFFAHHYSHTARTEMFGVLAFLPMVLIIFVVILISHFIFEAFYKAPRQEKIKLLALIIIIFGFSLASFIPSIVKTEQENRNSIIHIKIRGDLQNGVLTLEKLRNYCEDYYDFAEKEIERCYRTLNELETSGVIEEGSDLYDEWTLYRNFSLKS